MLRKKSKLTPGPMVPIQESTQSQLVFMTEPLKEVQVLQSLKSHSGDVVTCDFGDNFYLATGSGDKTIIIWEWKPGLGFVSSSYSPLIAHKYPVTCVKFSPQTTLLASSSIDGNTLVWNVANGECILSFVQSNGADVRSCCFTPDAKVLISCDYNGSICVWSLILKSLIHEIQGHEESICSACCSQKSNVFTTVDISGGLKVWSLPHHSSSNSPINCLLAQSDIHDLGANSVDISKLTADPDLKNDIVVTCGNDNLIKIWHLCPSKEKNFSLKLKWNLEGHTSNVTCVRLNEEGTLVASTSLDKTIKIWLVERGTCCITLDGHLRYVACCSFSKDGSLLATGSNDKTAMVWDLTGKLTTNSKLKDESFTSDAGSQFIRSIEQAVLKHSELEPNSIELWQRINDLKASMNSCYFSKNNLLVAGGSDKLVYVWYSDENRRLVELETSPFVGHQYPISQVEVSSCGELVLSGSIDGMIIVWNLKTGKKVLNVVHCLASGLRGCRFSPDSRLIAAASNDESVFVFRADNGQLIETLGGHYEGVTCIAFSNDSQYLVSGCGGGHLRAWGASPLHSFHISVQNDAHDLGVTSCDFAPSTNSNNLGKSEYLLASCGNDSVVRLWILKIRYESQATFSLFSELTGHGGAVTCVRFSQFVSDLLASTASDKTARLWNTNSCDCLNVIDYKVSMLTNCAFSADSNFLATSSLDKSLVIWELSKDTAFSSFAQMRASTSTTESISAFGSTKLVSKSLIPEAEKMLNSLKTGNYELKLQLKHDLNMISSIPHDFVCPITHQIMLDPVVSADGYTYERSAIESWFSQGKHTSPMTNEVLSCLLLVPNKHLKRKITQFSILSEK